MRSVKPAPAHDMRVKKPGSLNVKFVIYLSGASTAYATSSGNGIAPSIGRGEVTTSLSWGKPRQIGEIAGRIYVLY